MLVFLLPGLFFYIVFLIWPSIQAFWISLTDWDGLAEEPRFVGIDNYARLFEDSVVGTAAVNNLLWTIVTIVFPMVLGLTLAILLNRKSRTSPVFRTIFYAPAVLPLVSIASIWAWLYDPTDGAINPQSTDAGSEQLLES